MKWLWFAVKNVGRNRRRSLLTILVAAVGTAAILIGGGFALYTYDALREMAARDSGHLIVAQHGQFALDENTPMQYGLGDYQKMTGDLTADARVRAVLPRLQFSGLISNGDKSAVFVGTGVDPGAEFTVRGPFLTVVSGSTLSARPVSGEGVEVMLGQDLARQLHAVAGSSLTLLSTTTAGALNAQDVVVKGLFTVGVPDIDRRIIFVDIGTAQKLLLTDKVSTLSVYLDDIELTDPMRASVAAQVQPGQEVQTWRDQAFYYLAVRGLYNRIFGLLGFIVVVLVLFAVSNTLSMAVLERTREIGTLRALGAQPFEIIRNFALEGLVVGGSGVALGMALAAAISTLLDTLGVQMPPAPGRSMGYPLHVNITLALYGLASLAVILVSVAAAWFVTRKAAKQSIVRSLTYV